MIFIEGLRHRRAIWGRLGSAHMISDASIEDLRTFANELGLPDYWFHWVPVPHFELSSWWRRRALRAGAVDCAGLDRHELYVGALRRFLEAHPDILREETARLLVERAAARIHGDR